LFISSLWLTKKLAENAFNFDERKINYNYRHSRKEFEFEVGRILENHHGKYEES